MRAGKTLLRNISWQLRQGEHWRIRGPNGSGKSTFLRLLYGDECAYAGGECLAISARTGRRLTTLAERHKTISLVSDLGQAAYDYALTGLELVLSGNENSIGLYRDYDGAEVAAARELLGLFFGDEAAAIAGQSIRRLSTGQLRRLFLARSLVCRPEILLLDEPLSGLDAKRRSEFLDLLDKLAAGGFPGFRPALVFVSHEDEGPTCINCEAEIQAGELVNQRRL